MKKIGIIIIFSLLANMLWAQQIPKPNAPIKPNIPTPKIPNTVLNPTNPTLVNPVQNPENKLYLVQSDYATGFQGKDLMYVIKPIFKQGNATLTCDSANFYPSKSYFEAFGNVHINHADTTNVFSERLDYDGLTKQAYLTDNVELINPSSTLTTNILNYNLGTKIGTYNNGGTLENKSVTINSKNGYYFGSSQDVYFRYNVVAKTKQSTIKTDTLRFNSNKNTAFFYGPTNIYGKDDQLYTENGTYNTKEEQAFFGKNNLYNQGSKYLKGDSLFYDGKAGYGKAIKNIKFLDTIERIEMYGQKGYYYKINKYTLVTDRAFLVMSTKDTLKVNNTTKLDSTWMTADTLSTQMLPKDSVKIVERIKVKADDEVEDTGGSSSSGDMGSGMEHPTESGGFGKQSTETNPLSNRRRNKNNPNADGEKPITKFNKPLIDHQKTKEIIKKPPLANDSLALKLKDSLAHKIKILKLDSLPKQVIDSLKLLDSSKLDSVSESNQLGLKLKIPENLKFSKNKKINYGTIKQGGSVDSLGNFKVKNAENILPDSALTRVITAFHHVKIFKSNIQSKSDSVHYNSLDSTIRCFKDPIIWSDKTQLTGDTIYIQMRNNKLDAVHAFRNTFMSQVEEQDTLKFNQVKGREMTGVFAKGKLANFYIDGNAESMYYTKKDSITFSGLNKTVSSRIKVNFKDGKVVKVIPIMNVDGSLYPMTKLPESLEMKGFSWKPKDRPKSKEDVIPKNLTPKAIEKIKLKSPVKKKNPPKKKK